MASDADPRRALGKLASFVDVNRFDEKGLTPLHRAASENDVEGVKVLIAAGADVHSVPQQTEWTLGRIKIGDAFSPFCVGWTALHFAARAYDSTAVRKEDRVNCVAVLVEAGADVNSTDDHDTTPLHVAASEDSADLVAALVSRGAEIDCEDENGETPLILAIESNQTACVARLLQLGANGNYEHDFSRPLHFAATNPTPACVDLLIAAGADVNCRNYEDHTPLHKAAKSYRLDCVASLVKVRETNIDAEDMDGFTPFHYAMVGGARGWEENEMTTRLYRDNCRRCIGLLFEAGAFFSTPAPWTTALQKTMFFEYYRERAHGPALEYMRAIAKAGGYDALVRNHRSVFSALIQRALESRFGWSTPQVVAEQILGFWMPPGGW